MNGGVVCDNCGGTDFYKESGYYYCNECQVQTQEIQEQLYLDDVVDFENIKTKKSDRIEKNDDGITTWECYNHALLGITNELINLGADPQLKKVVKVLWLKYLEKLEVFKRGKNITPKLPAVGSKADAAIVYGVKKKRKRRKSSKSSKSSDTDVDSTILDIRAMRRETAKKKRALVEAFSQEISQRTAAEMSESLNDTTLQSIQSDSESSKSSCTKLKLNRYARRTLLKKMSATHLKLHNSDVDGQLTCHNFQSRSLGRYVRSVYFLSPKKLYIVLYAALLIVSDKHHLNDILDFIDQGHLTFNDYYHFFPEEFLNKSINKIHSIHTKMTWESTHKQTMQFAKALHITNYLQCPNLIELADRYCTELNLPKQFCHCVHNLISRAKIHTNFSNRDILATNYTGRVLSIILVVVKIFFSLDDVTEYHYSELAQTLNKSKRTKPKMFDCVAWLKYLEYRQLIMKAHHWPSTRIEDGMHNLDGYYELLSNKKFYTEYKKNRDDLMFILTKLKDEHDIESKLFRFPASLTPYREITKILCQDSDLRQNNYMFDILQMDFADFSIDHMLKPDKLIKAANHGEQPKLYHRNAQENVICEQLRDISSEDRQQWKKRNKLIEAISETNHCKNKQTSAELINNNNQFDFDEYDRVNATQFTKNLHRSRKYSEDINLKVKKIQKDLVDSKSYSTHYISYERYWMRFMVGHHVGSENEWQEFYDGFPNNFKIVFNELLRISKQSVKTLLFQFIFTEMYLVYSTEKFSGFPNDEIVKEFLKTRMHLW